MFHIMTPGLLMFYMYGGSFSVVSRLSKFCKDIASCYWYVSRDLVHRFKIDGSLSKVHQKTYPKSVKVFAYCLLDPGQNLKNQLSNLVIEFSDIMVVS